jgi:hypothetical protein
MPAEEGVSDSPVRLCRGRGVLIPPNCIRAFATTLGFEEVEFVD